MPRWWTERFMETDLPNPLEGGNLWTWAKVRPWWYWWYQRLSLFLFLAWRMYDEQGSPISVPTAWEVSKVAMGLTRHHVHRYRENPEVKP